MLVLAIKGESRLTLVLRICRNLSDGRLQNANVTIEYAP